MYGLEGRRAVAMGRPQSAALLLVGFFVSLSVFACALGAEVEFFWVIQQAIVKPDCVTKEVTTINGIYPGPEIIVTQGDTVIVHVQNQAHQNVSMHWHGLHVRGTPYQDGNAYGAQCPILVNQTFTYYFSTADQVGTFWYHGHIGFLRHAAYGALIVRPRPDFVEPIQYDAFRYLLLNDWYYPQMHDVEVALGERAGTWIAPDGLLINGRSRMLCSTLQSQCDMGFGDIYCQKVHECNNTGCSLNTFPVEQGKTYRFHIVNVGMYGNINLQFEKHNLTVVEADGAFLKPVEVPSLDILPGQTFSVLVKMTAPIDNYWIVTNGVWDARGLNKGLAVLRYIGAPTEEPTSTPPEPYSDSEQYTFPSMQQIEFRHYYDQTEKIPKRPIDRNILIKWAQNLINGYARYSVNNISYAGWTENAMAFADWAGLPGVFNVKDFKDDVGPLAPKGTLGPAKLGFGVANVHLGDYVQLVFQSNTPPGLAHPWHLHGYEFWVMYYGDGVYNASMQEEYEKSPGWNAVDPPLRNVVSVYQDKFVIVRFVADNPGMWHLHCHLEPHFHLGMAAYIRVHDPKLPAPPANYPRTCGILAQNYIEEPTS